MDDTRPQTALKEDKDIPDANFWAQLRASYFKAKEGPELDEHDEKLAKAVKASNTGALIEFEIRQGEYGRGIFTKHSIKAGTPVWKFEHEGVFRTEKQWLDFLKLLPPHMQHDCVTWAYSKDGILYLDLEPCTLFNHGGSAIPDELEFVNIRPDNMKYVEIPNSDDEWYYVAKCDIMPGDELLCDYTVFHDFAKPLTWFEDSCEQIVEEGIYY